MASLERMGKLDEISAIDKQEDKSAIVEQNIEALLQESKDSMDMANFD